MEPYQITWVQNSKDYTSRIRQVLEPYQITWVQNDVSELEYLMRFLEPFVKSHCYN